MTDRSSQPCSYSEQPNITQETTQVTKGSRRFTVTLNKKSDNVASNSEGSVKISLNEAKDKKTAKPSQPNKQTSKQSSKIAEKTVTDTDTLELPTIPMNIDYPDTHKPAVLHAHFDSKRKKINPTRPLTDIPEPAPRSIHHSENVHDMFARFELEGSIHQRHEENTTANKSKKATHEKKSKTKPIQEFITQAEQRNYEKLQTKSVIFDNNASKWELIQSPALADHLALLSAGGLAKIPKSFYRNTSIQPLLSSIENMTLVDMSQILSTINQLTHEYNCIVDRQGLIYKQRVKTNINNRNISKKIAKHKEINQRTNQPLPTANDIHTLEHASIWEVILYPQRFDDDSGHSNLSTDIMAISVVKHALSQCLTRQSINEKLTAKDIAKYLRSYLLSQCNQLPHKREHLKHTNIYAGHVIVVAKMLGWQMEVISQDTSEGKNKSEVIFNVSSRCGLFARYPLLSDYYVKGWE